MGQRPAWAPTSAALSTDDDCIGARRAAQTAPACPETPSHCWQKVFGIFGSAADEQPCDPGDFCESRLFGMPAGYNGVCLHKRGAGSHCTNDGECLSGECLKPGVFDILAYAFGVFERQRQAAQEWKPVELSTVPPDHCN